jgi:hypothetical protein
VVFSFHSRTVPRRTNFVRREDLPPIRKQLKNYERMKSLVDHWIDLTTVLSILQIMQNQD